jgi:hypothetical protein
VLRGHFLPADRRRLFFESALPRSKALLGAITLILVCAYLVSGVRYALYAPATSNYYLWAVYHVHSTMSDGLDSPLEIARQARMARVALVILTDHGNPNPAASAFRMRADGVTIVGGSEAKLPEGRLTFFGARQVPRFALASAPPEAIDQARLWGAFPIVLYRRSALRMALLGIRPGSRRNRSIQSIQLRSRFIGFPQPSPGALLSVFSILLP